MSMQLMMARARMNHQSGSAGDPYWANVVSLLPLTGTNGGTSFPDSTGRVWAPNGGITTSAAQSKFGGGSALFSGSQFLSSSQSIDFAMGNGDFTIEVFAYVPSSISGDQSIFNVGLNSGTSSGLRSNALFSGPNSVSYGVTSPAPVSFNAWVHQAACRASGIMRVFYDGVAKASGPDSYSYVQGVGFIGAGSSNNGGSVTSYLHAYLNYLRITKGIARYTANFTPPAAPFPNHA